MKKTRLFVLKMVFVLLCVSLSYGTHAQTNNALNFANNAYVSTNYTPNTMQAYTFSAWIYLDDYTGTNQEKMICGNADISFNGFWLEVNKGYVRTWNNHQVDMTSTTLLPLNKWIHVAVTYDLTKVSVYINGVLDISTTTTISSAGGTTLTIGRIGLGQSWFFGNGRIDELSAWNVALTAAQILNIYNNALTGSESGLVAYYKFNQGVANGTNTGITTLNDEKSAYAGTLLGFTLSGTTSNWVGGFSLSTAVNLISANDNISISQNAEKQITVTLNGISNFNGGIISVYNANGQKLITQPIDADKTLLNTQFNAGIYLVSVSIDGQTATKKVLVK